MLIQPASSQLHDKPEIDSNESEKRDNVWLQNPTRIIQMAVDVTAKAWKMLNYYHHIFRKHPYNCGSEATKRDRSKRVHRCLRADLLMGLTKLSQNLLEPFFEFMQSSKYFNAKQIHLVNSRELSRHGRHS